MSNICPLCNGMENIEDVCTRCSELMQDGGKIENYFGPYSPYEEHWDSIQRGELCTHLVYCPSCGSDYRIVVRCIGEK